MWPSVCVCGYLLDPSRYLLVLQKVGWLDVAAYWRSLDVQLQLGLWLLLHQQLLPQLLHHLFLEEEEEEEKRVREVQNASFTYIKSSLICQPAATGSDLKSLPNL